MSTHYYWHWNARCQCCHRRGDELLHIGSGTAGQAFILHVGGPCPRNFEGWIRLWCQQGSEIRDEFGCRQSVEQMVRTVCGVRHRKTRTSHFTDHVRRQHRISLPA